MLSPSATSSTSGTWSKRSASVMSDDLDGNEPQQRAPKRKATSSGSKKASASAREERMERNRREYCCCVGNATDPTNLADPRTSNSAGAAQASRDRKKMQQETLESRVQDLEAQLEAARRRDQPVVFAVPDPPAVGDADSRVALLEQENQTLRVQLQVEQVQSATLKNRLGALESKFSRLEELLRGDFGSLSQPSAQTPSPTTSTSHLYSSESSLSTPLPPSQSQLEQLTVISNLDAVQIQVNDSSRLVAREVITSLPRKLSNLQSVRPPLRFHPRSLVTRSSRRQRQVATTLVTLSLPTPSLHQILSSITILEPSPYQPPSTTTLLSRPLGTTGQPTLTLPLMPARSTLVTRRRHPVCFSNITPMETCSRTFKNKRCRVFVRR